jgi:cellobiose phosphorylase
MPQQQHQRDSSNKRQTQIALQALKEDATLFQHCAAAIHDVSQSTLSNWYAWQLSQADHWSKSRNLNKLKEGVIVEHILELVAQRFSFRLAAVADMANSLRAKCNMGQVSMCKKLDLCWPQWIYFGSQEHHRISWNLMESCRTCEVRVKAFGWRRSLVCQRLYVGSRGVSEGGRLAGG